MEDINGNEINEVQELGTKKYNIKINNRYLVDFKETNNKSGKGGYSNGHFESLSAMPPLDIIVVSENKKDAKLIEGKSNLKSVTNKLLSDWNYKFYNIEIIEIENSEGK